MPSVARLRRSVLAWYEREARVLPWRIGPAARKAGALPDPYQVWLSEIMLQQTTVGHATPYFLAFLRRWPTVAALASAEDAEVMALWAGLGYYARARNLLKCAREIAAAHGGVFPATEEALERLPGVGPYTAAAIAAIAFDRPTNVVDGNVERVVARLFASAGDKRELRRLAADLVGHDRPGDWAQALMDLGSTICTPTAPACARCPARADCMAFELGSQDAYPRKRARPERPHRHGATFVLTRGREVALVRRPARGLLGGMLALPTTEWRAEPVTPCEAMRAAPIQADWRNAGEVRHGFTHFTLDLTVYAAEGDWPQGLWTSRDALSGLPSLFLKAARAALGAA